MSSNRTELTKKSRMAIAKFLNTEAGLDLVQYMKWITPTIAPAPESHVMQFNSGVSQGWSACAGMLDTLSVLQTPTAGTDEADTLDR